MRVNLKIAKDTIILYEGIYDVRDASSFGSACADAWTRLSERQFEKATSIGALYETLNDGVLEDLRGAHIVLEQSRP